MNLRNNITMAPLLLITIQPCFADTQRLQDLVQRGILEVALAANGGHAESCITLRATNRSAGFVTAKLEPGSMLIASDETQQDILVTQELILALQPDQMIERQVYGFCFQSLDASPSQGCRFMLGPVDEGALKGIADFLNAHRDIPSSNQQEAIWVVSDCHPLSSIHVSDELSNTLSIYVADLLGLEKPWYTTDHVRTAEQLFTRQVERIYGEMAFDVSDYTTLDITILDADGRVVKRLVRSTIYGPGNYTQPIDLYVTRWPQGKYAVLFENEHDDVVKEYSFEL